MLTTSLLIGLAGATAAFGAAVALLPPLHSRPASGRPTQDYTPVTDIWVDDWSHAAPDYQMGTDEAHLTMQRHRECRRSACARKDAAYMTLVDVGHIKPQTEGW